MENSDFSRISMQIILFSNTYSPCYAFVTSVFDQFLIHYLQKYNHLVLKTTIFFFHSPQVRSGKEKNTLWAHITNYKAAESALISYKLGCPPESGNNPYQFHPRAQAGLEFLKLPQMAQAKIGKLDFFPMNQKIEQNAF